MTGSPNGRQALAYAGRDWAVLPLWWPLGAAGCACRRPECDSVGKHPVADLVPRGLLEATTSPAILAAWWRELPLANVGIRTGAGGGLVVVDVDGHRGLETLRELGRRHGRFDAGWVRTGSGGWHAYLAHPGSEIRNSAGRLGAGLDVRGDGGYVVAPPSLHASGFRYRWRTRPVERLPSVPSWMLELLLPPSPSPARPVRLSGSGLSSYVLAAVEGEAHEAAAAPGGQRNNRLNLAAYRLGQLVGAGLIGEAAVADILMIAARAAGLGEHEAQATVRSGLRAGARRPRDIAR